MVRQWSDRVDFVTVYIKEAHPTDEWQMSANEDDDVCYPQPRSTADRVAIAKDFVKRFRYEMTLLVDPIDNPADTVYAGWPERLYVIAEDGRIAYKGEPGPFGYHPDEVQAWLEQWAAGSGSMVR